MDITERLKQIKRKEEYLGIYTGILISLYEKDFITSKRMSSELDSILQDLISLKGIDHEDVIITNQLIKEFLDEK